MSVVDDVRRAVAELKAVEMAIAKTAPEATLEGAEMLLEDVRRRIPKDSGMTAADAMAELELSNQSGAVASVHFRGRAFIARFLEFGTRKMRKRPFLRPAADAQEKPIGRHIRQRVDTAVKRAT